jgi:phosphomannomutase
MLDPDLLAAVASWSAQDPDSHTRAQLEALLEGTCAGNESAATELTDAFVGRLQFGTAGLRGQLGPGPNRMNRVVVGQAARGLATYLLDAGMAGGRVLIGYDARYKSDRFARDTAEIMAGAGFEAWLAPSPLPTPVIAFGIRHFGCVAAVVVTASHNPRHDNGYKVYLGDGSQIVPPADAEIASRIAEVAKHDIGEMPRSPHYRVLDDALTDAYLTRVASLVPPEAPRTLRWVYTPLHGVGGATVEAAVAAAGFPPPIPVVSQSEPDPEFPTVSFPNPEEPGALDLALSEAESSGADLLIANDPDADRCAVAVPIDGSWRILRGDELGAVLAYDSLQRGVRGTYACSVVSSTLLAAMAASHAQPFVSTLTGFKWIGRVPGLAFGYEEALGYCCDPAFVADKDGISALLAALTLAARRKAVGRGFRDLLDEIDRTYGVYATGQHAVRVDDLGLIETAMARLRAKPPARLAGEPVSYRNLKDGSSELPPTDAVLLEGPAVRVVVRPSGTEPKLKCYLEARRLRGDGFELGEARSTAAEKLNRLRADIASAIGLPGGS